MINEARKLDLSDKFIQMGKALITEGGTTNDYTVSQSGTIMILMASLVLNDEDMFLFSELVAMFSSKKILESMEQNGFNVAENINKYLKNDNDKPKTKKKRGKKSDDINEKDEE